MPTSEMVDAHMWKDTVSLENPIDLFFFAPDDIPIIIPGLFPLSTGKGIIDTVFKGSLEFNIAPASS